MKRLAASALCCAVLSGLFAFAVATVMLTDYYRLKTVSPLNLPALKELNKRLAENPDDESLKREIRELDLLARTFYFNTTAKFRIGAALLAAGAALSLLFTQAYLAARPRVAQPTKRPPPEDPMETAAKARRVLISASLWSLAGVSAFVFLSGGGDSPRTSRKATAAAASESAEKPAAIPPDGWPAFRGFRGAARFAGAASGIPTLWNAATGSGVAWSAPLPSKGFSSPILLKERLFMTGGDKKRREVFCVDAATGETLWRSTVPFMAPAGSKLPKPTSDTGFAAPTMATDGKLVFAIFATGDIAALTLDGDSVWGKSLGVPVNHYAYASSLLVEDGKLIVQLYNSKDPRLLALNPADGTVVWTNRTAKEISWSSPVSAEIAGKPAVIVQSSAAVLAVSLSNGATIWRTECLTGEVAPSPSIAGGRVFAANDNASAVALDLATGKKLWENEDVDLPEVASVLATDGGRVYLAASFGPLTCLDAATGKTLWVHEFDTGFYSSPVLVGDLIYLTDLKGRTRIIKDSADFELVQTSDIGEPCFCTPVFSREAVFLRGDSHLFKIAAAR